MINSLGVESRGTANQSMDFIALSEEELCKIRAVLTCYSSY
jgi:hypothetical protein